MGSSAIWQRIIVWTLIYLWTAAASLELNQIMDWQYDGDLGWWLVAAFAFPALGLADLLFDLTGDPNAITKSLVLLFAVSVILMGILLALRRRKREA